MGVGITGPTAKLHIFERTANTAVGLKLQSYSWDASLSLINDQGTWEILNDRTGLGTNGTLAFYNGGYKMALTPAGNLGIGTTNPYAQLHISHSLGNGGLMLGNTATTGSKEMLLNIHPLGLIWQRWVNGAFQSNLMTLDYDGHLGIGNTNPSRPLDITSDSSAVALRLRARTNNDYSFMQFTNNAGTANWSEIYATGAASSATALHFSVGTATVEKMKLTTSLLQLTTGASNQGIIQMSTSADYQIRGGGNYGYISLVAPILRFDTAGTERMRVDGAGTLDIKGQNNNVNGMAAIIARLGSNSDNTTSYAFIAETGGANKCFIHGNGNIVNANNSYGSLSDKRLKENIKDATPKLDDLMKVKVRNFNMIGDKSKQIGVVAQELEEVFPSMISENKGSNPNDETLYKGVKYSVFVPILIKAIQELKAEIELLKSK